MSPSELATMLFGELEECIRDYDDLRRRQGELTKEAEETKKKTDLLRALTEIERGTTGVTL